MRYVVEIPGRPVPKGRPRTGKGGRIYTPKRTREYEAKVALLCRAVADVPMEGRCRVEVEVWFSDRRKRDLV